MTDEFKDPIQWLDDSDPHEATLGNPRRMGIRLQIKYTDDSGTHIVERTLGYAPLKIGRAEGNSIVIVDSTVSKVHAALRYDDYGLWIKDLQSKNGTTVNGRQVINECNVGADDTIRIGHSTLWVRTLGAWGEDQGEKTLRPRRSQVSPVKLRLTYNDSAGCEVRIVTLEESITLGRDVDCGVRIMDPTVSAHHAILSNRGQEGVFIAAAKASAEIILDGVPIANTVQVSSGAQIELGDVKIKLEIME